MNKTFSAVTLIEMRKKRKIEISCVNGLRIKNNIRYMAQFYAEYQSNTILQPMVAEISWTKHVAIMTKCSDTQQRQFYILATKKFGWIKDVLINKKGIPQKCESYLLGIIG